MFSSRVKIYEVGKDLFNLLTNNSEIWGVTDINQALKNALSISNTFSVITTRYIPPK